MSFLLQSAAETVHQATGRHTPPPIDSGHFSPSDSRHFSLINSRHFSPILCFFFLSLSFKLRRLVTRHTFKMDEHECHSCYKSFPTFRRVMQHMDDTQHWDEDRICNTCSTKFFYEFGIDDHYDETGHEFYCKSCERSFQNQNSLNMV